MAEFGYLKRTVDFIPRNELGVILIFGRFHDYLGFKIVDIHSAYPDCILKKQDKLLNVEFEYASSNFVSHYHNPKECDLVICWMKDIELPVEILELRSALAQFIDSNAKVYSKPPLKNHKQNMIEKVKRIPDPARVKELEEVIRMIENEKRNVGV